MDQECPCHDPQPLLDILAELDAMEREDVARRQRLGIPEPDEEV